MANTLKARLPIISQKIYKEWLAQTYLVQSCSSDYEGEFDLDKNEIDIPVFGHLTIHKTSLKERSAKPAPLEFTKGSTMRVTLDKGRYNHWGEGKLEKLIEKLDMEDSVTRARLVQDWALDAEEELACACARLTSKRHLDVKTLLGAAVTKDNVIKFLDMLKDIVKQNHMSANEFTYFGSDKLASICRDKQLEFYGKPAEDAFKKGFLGTPNGVNMNMLEVDALIKRNASTAAVEAEYAIWKTRDAIQYVVPYKNTVSYEIKPDQILMGGTGYQTLEYYDFFNLYKERLYILDMKYTDTATLPTFGSGGNANVLNKDNLIVSFGTVK